MKSQTMMILCTKLGQEVITPVVQVTWFMQKQDKEVALWMIQGPGLAYVQHPYRRPRAENRPGIGVAGPPERDPDSFSPSLRAPGKSHPGAEAGR